MMKHFILKRTDGGVTILHLLQQEDGSYSTPEKEIGKWTPEKQAGIVSYREVSRDGIPTTHAFREAWCDVTPEPMVDIDMPKARDIHRDRLRAMRTPKLAALDIEMTRAFNDKAKQAAIDARRQALRDATQHPSIEAAQTPDELMAAIPDALK